MTFEQIVRPEFTALDSGFFNTAYFGPIPKRAQNAGIQAIQRASNPVNIHYDDWRPIPDMARETFAQLLGVSSENISHHGSTSEVMTAVSLGFPFQRTGTVVLMEGDYPSDILPWMVNSERSGYKILKLKEECFRDIDLMRKGLPADAKILNFSHVMFNTGRRSAIQAIGKLCQERGILMVIDVSQSFGGVALTAEEVKVCDVIAGSSYKWMLGPYGHAFAYWSDRALKEIANVHISWQASEGSRPGDMLNYTIKPLPGARKFDRGQAPNIIGMKMLIQSLGLLAEVTLPAIEKHNRALVSQFLETFPKSKYNVITPIGEHANIISIRQTAGGSVEALQASLREKKIDASIREGNLRMSFHLFNTQLDVENLVKAL
jgi:cysteine desulfurase / selenocysteine lyase